MVCVCLAGLVGGGPPRVGIRGVGKGQQLDCGHLLAIEYDIAPLKQGSNTCFGPLGLYQADCERRNTNRIISACFRLSPEQTSEKANWHQVHIIYHGYVVGEIRARLTFLPIRLTSFTLRLAGSPSRGGGPIENLVSTGMPELRLWGGHCPSVIVNEGCRNGSHAEVYNTSDEL